MVLGDVTNTTDAATRPSQQEPVSRSPSDGFGDFDPLAQPEPDTFEGPHDFFSRDPLVLPAQPKPSKDQLDAYLQHFENQLNHLRESGEDWSVLVFQYDTAQLPTLIDFLLNLHSGAGAAALTIAMSTFANLEKKLEALIHAYYSIGQDPSMAHFQAIANRITAMDSVLTSWRYWGIGMLADISGMAAPPLDPATNAKDICRLVALVRHKAIALGYRMYDGHVFIQDKVQLDDGTVHVTPHWRNVERDGQPGTTTYPTPWKYRSAQVNII